MSLPLKPLTIDSNSKQLDSKQKKFNTNVVRALEHFDSVTEWADYIASLGKLLKALQSWSPQFQNVRYYVPTPYQVSRRLTSSLSPNLPAGVHQKTLEVYTFIFERIGEDTLAAECNIWIPGLLPLMTYASMSVKSHLIELYDNYLITLPSTTLKLLIRPFLASLLPGIDDESSEFQPLVMKLIESLKENLADDSLFWQTCFLVMITSKERRLGGLIWLTKKLPSLNSVPHLVAQNNKGQKDTVDERKKEPNTNSQDIKENRAHAFSILLPAAQDVLSPEPGLLIRCLVCCLAHENDLIIKRGIWDLLLQRFHLDSPVLDSVVSHDDKKLLIMSCCKTTLEKDMSLNRRVWNWLLGPSFSAQSNSNATIAADNEDKASSTEKTNQYFANNGVEILVEGLKDMIKVPESIPTAFNICLSIMDRWELGSLIIPEMFIPLLCAVKEFSETDQILKSANIFFDNVETNIIWGKIYQHLMSTADLEFLMFILTNFNIAYDEEIIVRHLPLVLLALLCDENMTRNAPRSTKDKSYRLCSELLKNIPERAFLPLDSSQLNFHERPKNSRDIVQEISKYYAHVCEPVLFQDIEPTVDMAAPFDHHTLSFMAITEAHEMLLESLEQNELVIEAAKIFIAIYEKIPENSSAENPAARKVQTCSDERLLNAVIMRSKKATESDSNSVFGIVDILSSYMFSRITLLESNKLLKLILSDLWQYLINPCKQIDAIKSLKKLERSVDPICVEGALSCAFLQEEDITRSLIVLELLWNHLEPRSTLIRRPLELIIDDLFSEENPRYLSVSKWVLSVVNSGSANRLFYFLTHRLLTFDFLKRNELEELDDLDMFTYHIQALTSVLKTNNGVIVKQLSTELSSIDSLATWENEDISTYKNLVLAVIMRFLNMKKNHNAKSIRSCLILLECLLNGTERNFREIVIALLEMSSKYISQGGLDAELIAVSLLNIVSKVLRLSHANGIKLDIFDDNGTHVKYVDYLVTSVSSMESPLIVTSYMKLLSESVIYFEKSMFRMILPLSASIVECVKKMFMKEKKDGGHYQSISLLLGGLEEILEVSHSFLLNEEKEGYHSGNNSKGDFLQSMVSNVFSSESSTNEVKIKGERDVILQSFKLVVNCCFDIWSWAHGLFIINKGNGELHQVNYNSYKFKFIAKKLLEKMFTLEPTEVMEDLVIRSTEDSITLIHVLDGNRPALSIPYLFLGIVRRQNKNASIKLSISTGNLNNFGNRVESSLMTKLDSKAIVRFLIKFAFSVENAAVEDFYSDFYIFMKEVTANYANYDPISKAVLKFVAIIAQKLNRSKFGQQKKIRRDLSDIFAKYLPNALGDSPFEYVDTSKEFSDLEFVVINLQYILNDEVGGDRYNSCISTIIMQCITPYMKRKNIEPPNAVLKLMHEIAKVSGKVKSWRIMINDYFLDDKNFLYFAKSDLWAQIIFEWSQYPENKSKLIADLLSVIDSKTTSMTPTLITFNSWSESENDLKSQNILRIIYLLMVLPVDYHLLHFQELISCICQYLSSKNSKLKGKCWILLRAMLLRYRSLHFTDYWSMIIYCLQTNLQEFYESLQIQAEIDSSHVLQICKTLDLLLSLNLEGFSATNEWLFIIDTINCIYKDYPFMSLIDKIYECKEFEVSQNDTIEFVDRENIKVPLLIGTNCIQSHLQLRIFFQNLSYAHFEYVYSLAKPDIKACEDDVYLDIFT